MNTNRVAVLVCAWLLLLCGDTRAASLSGLLLPRATGDNVDLSNAGTSDWVHWGLNSTNATRKVGVSPVVTSYGKIGANIPRQITNDVEFSWTGGSPTTVATNVVTSAGIGGLTNGFTFDLEAPTSLRKLKVYVGVQAARGRLEVTLPDVPAFIDQSLDSTAATNGVYIFDFAASKNNDRLRVRFTAADVYDTNGFVTLQAAAYGGNSAPSVAVTSPANEKNILTGEQILTASALDSDGFITKVEFFIAGTTKIGEVTNAPYVLGWTATNQGLHTLTARATDNNGAQTTSSPVSVFVTGDDGLLLSAVAGAPANVNLAQEGTTDWVHWGLFTQSSVNRKTGVVPQIGALTIIGLEPAYHYADNETTYSWTGGTPTSTFANTPTGLFVAGLNNGFNLTVPADTYPRTLRVYVGAYGARAKLTAQLSDYSAPVIIDRSIEHFGNGPAYVYSFYYSAATDGQTLSLSFTCDKKHDLQYANVTFQAATLVSAVDPLSISLLQPTNNVVLDAPANIQFEAAIAGSAVPRKVEFFNGSTNLGQDTNAPYTLDWNGVPPGNYTITARTTNDVGIALVSAPVQVFVITGGGLMTGTFAPSDGSVDLTSEGTLDWMHWGLVRLNSLNRKRDVPQQISDVTEIGRGRADQYGDNLVAFQWSDGTPTLSVGGTTTGIFKYESGGGFQITVPAGPKVRRLKVFVGVFAAKAEFQATLSDSSAAPYIDSSVQSVYNSLTGVHTIDFASASPGQTLTVRHISKTLFDPDWGNCTFQAAALSFIPPYLQVAPAGGGNELSFPTEAGWTYFVDRTESLDFPIWMPVTNFGGTGASIGFTDFGSGAQGFFRLRIVK
jgi:hypothetical protein